MTRFGALLTGAGESLRLLSLNVCLRALTRTPDLEPSFIHPTALALGDHFAAESPRRLEMLDTTLNGSAHLRRSVGPSSPNQTNCVHPCRRNRRLHGLRIWCEPQLPRRGRTPAGTVGGNRIPSPAAHLDRESLLR